MDFKKNDWVVHCTHGVGQVMDIEERVFFDKVTRYYMVQVSDLTIWVPADENLSKRLRLPSSPASFKKAISVLSTRAEKLPNDYRQRNAQLSEMLKDGSTDSLCRVIRDLSAYRHERSWSEHDNALMRRTQKALLGEWSYTLSITPHEAELELNKSLSHKTA